jgi:hypothetical protein
VFPQLQLFNLEFGMYWYADIDYIPESIDEPSSQVFAQWVNWNGIIIIKLYTVHTGIVLKLCILEMET